MPPKKNFKVTLLGDEFQTLDGPKGLELIRQGLAEMLGTAFLVGLGCMGTQHNVKDSSTHLNVVFSFAFAIATSVMVFGHVSGSHINPALSLVAVVMGKISLQKMAIYSFFQCLGAVMGYSITRSLFPVGVLPPKFCCTFPSDQIALSQAFAAEFVLTAVISMVLCAAFDYKCLDKHDSLPLKFGFAVTAIALPGAQFAGCSVNPARSFGPALITGEWENHWIYWVAPLSGAFVASLIYRVLFYDNPDNHQSRNSQDEVDETTLKLNAINDA